MIRFLFKLKCKTGRITGEELLPEEVLDAEGDIICQAQYEAYTEEYVALAERKPLPGKSQLTKLSPQLDENGLVSLKGRIMFVPVVYCTGKRTSRELRGRVL